MYRNIQSSLLRYCSDKALYLTTTYGNSFKAENFDAFANDNSFPESNLIGIEDLTMQSESDGQAKAIFNAQITVSTLKDPNNMLLSQVVDMVFKDFQPQEEFTVYNIDTGVAQFKAITIGTTRITRVMHGKGSRVFQGVSFRCAVV